MVPLVPGVSLMLRPVWELRIVPIATKQRQRCSLADCIHLQGCLVLYYVYFPLTLRPCQGTADNLQPSCCTFSLQQQSPRGSSDMNQFECPLRNQRLKHQHLLFKILDTTTMKSTSLKVKCFSVSPLSPKYQWLTN